MKKTYLVIVLALVLAFAFSATAMANFGPHGGYAQDTDACAACHRAHTSFSEATWTDMGGNSRSALLVGNAATMKDFCYACHGEGAQGASTNVAGGVFDGAVSADDADVNVIPGVTMYQTESKAGGDLHGGAFEGANVTSVHGMEMANAPLWGYGASLAKLTNFTCSNCHDPHGSSNYRLLKDSLNGNQVGGYLADGTPTPFVVANEVNYPKNGFLKGAAGAAQINGAVGTWAKYLPDYTITGDSVSNPAGGLYNVISDDVAAESAIMFGDGNANISGWCSGCHEGYNVQTDGAGEGVDYAVFGTTAPVGSNAETDGTVGFESRHRHPVQTPVGAGFTSLAVDPIKSGVLPLSYKGNATDWDAGQLTCLTCHFAHGTEAVMTADSWAQGVDLDVVVASGVGGLTYDLYGPVQVSGGTGVAPNTGASAEDGSALLRADDRGVCQRCHDK